MATADLTRTDIDDATITAYWHTFAADDDTAAVAFAATPGASFDAARALAEHASDPHVAASVEEEIVRNLDIDDDTFDLEMKRVRREPGSHRDGVVLFNPFHADELCRLWPGLPRSSTHRRSILLNRGVHSDFIATWFHLDPYSAACNPNTAPWTLDRILDLSNDDRTEAVVLRHPRVDRELVDAALRGSDQATASAAVRSPLLSVDELVALRPEFVARSPFLGSVIDDEIERRTRDPLTLKAATLRFGPLDPTVAEALMGLSPDTRAAASRIARAGFAGTAAELFDVAVTCS